MEPKTTPKTEVNGKHVHHKPDAEKTIIDSEHPSKQFASKGHEVKK